MEVSKFQVGAEQWKKTAGSITATLKSEIKTLRQMQSQKKAGAKCKALGSRRSYPAAIVACFQTPKEVSLRGDVRRRQLFRRMAGFRSWATCAVGAGA